MIFWLSGLIYLVVGCCLYVSDARMPPWDGPAYVSSGSLLVKGFVVIAWPWVLLRRLSYSKRPTPSDDRFDNNDPNAWTDYGMQHIRKCNQIHWRHEQLFSLSSYDYRASTERKRERVKKKLRHYYSEAAAAFEQALKLDPANSFAKEHLASMKSWLERLQE
jgi:hypothetical protein